MQSRPAWYVRRLAAMSPIEIASRSRDAAVKRLDRMRRRSEPPLAPPQDVFAAFARAVPTLPLLPEWRAAFAVASSGQFTWFGAAWPGGDPPDWHLDPLSGQRWPLEFGPDIPYRSAAGFGDVKCTWELNRLQYLQPVAALAHATGDAAAAALVRRHVADWIEANPPGLGINWASGIEIALRAVSLLLVASLVPLDEALGRRLAACLAAHARWLRRYPSRHSSANNHAIAEALGLLLIGRALPHHPQGARWAVVGSGILQREARRQVLADGAGAEQALAYHGFTLEMLALARLHDPGLPALTAAGCFLSAMTGPAGAAPAIGDDDESRVFWSPSGPEQYALAMQAALGVAPVLPSAAHLRQAALGAPPAARPAVDGFEHFPQGGVSVFRRGAQHLVFDHGPLGYLSIAAHGHADALAIWLQLDGMPLLIDAGTYRYHGAGLLRDALRGTLAHNTLAVGGADQSRIAGPFNWWSKARCAVTALDTAVGAVTAEHDGYRARFGCVHSRTVAMAADGFTVTDRLVGRGGPWPVSIGFLVAPGVAVGNEGDAWSIGPRLRVRHEGPLQGTAAAAEFSPCFGRMERTTRLSFGGRLGSADTARFVFQVG